MIEAQYSYTVLKSGFFAYTSIQPWNEQRFSNTSPSTTAGIWIVVVASLHYSAGRPFSSTYYGRIK